MNDQPSPKRRVVLFDDNAERIKTWRSKITSVPGLTDHFEVEAPDPRQFAKVFEDLRERQTQARDNTTMVEDEATILDDADVVIVDFDLTPASGHAKDSDRDALKALRGSFGDTFAYLTRCYTSAGYTVLVNQTFYQSTFDLTMREFELSYADLNVTDSDLDNEGLWFGKPIRDAYRPWHWPRLVDAGAFIRSLTEKIDLDGKVLATLGLDDPETYELFAPQQLDVLGKKDPLAATFASISGPDSRFGLLSENEAPTEAAQKKMAAVAVTHWLERFVIPSQNILVDAPHLAQRRPHLLLGEVTAERLDNLSDLDPGNDPDSYFDPEALDRAVTPANSWTLRPVWLWPAFPPGPIPDDDLVFCEDGSFFRPMEEANEYRSDLPGPFRTRFVAEIKSEDGFDIEYRPDTRLYEA